MSEKENVKSLYRLKIDESDVSYNDDSELSELQAVEFDMISPFDITDERQVEIYRGINEIDDRLSVINQRVDELNAEIDRLTNHADGIDYTIAVASGVLCGLIDSFFVGKMDLTGAKERSDKFISDLVKNYAKAKGCNNAEDLKSAVGFLEDKYKVPQDNVWSGKGYSSTFSHHLDDLAHHPTVLGLISSIVITFTGLAFFADKNGKWHFEFVGIDPKKLAALLAPVIIAGLFKWIANIIESKNTDNLDEKEIPKPIRNLVITLSAIPAAVVILKTANNWIGHLFSDMAGSKSSIETSIEKTGGDLGAGMGIPGLFLSLLKELSYLPVLKDTGLPKIVDDLYTNGIDMRMELALARELGKQAIPVIINEVLVRGFYFLRHLVKEFKEHDGFNGIDWGHVIPFGNRTIVRMMTIATGTFTAVDVADAAIRAAVASGGNPAVAAKEFVLRINFVGVGRFAIACFMDIRMGIQRSQKRNERMALMSEKLHLLNAKVFYKQADMWIAAENTGQAIQEVYVVMEKSAEEFVRSWNVIITSLDNITPDVITSAEEHNEGLIDELLDIL